MWGPDDGVVVQPHYNAAGADQLYDARRYDGLRVESVTFQSRCSQGGRASQTSTSIRRRHATLWRRSLRRDCWDDASHIRAWATEGDPGGRCSGDTVLVEDVTFTECGFGALHPRRVLREDRGPPGRPEGIGLQMDASVYLDFDRRYVPGGTLYEAELE